MTATENKTLTQDISKTFQRGKKIMADNPTISSLSFELSGYSVNEVKATAATLERPTSFSEAISAVFFCVSDSHNNHSIFIHVYSAEVKAKVIYE